MSGGESTKGNREQEIAAISRGLKMIAKELEVPVIALSQLSRAVETRGGDKRPMLSDLRESGSIEQDADMVIFLYRPEYYGITEDIDGNPTEGVGEVMIAKHRNGALENVPLKFVGKYAKFENLDSYDQGGGNAQSGAGDAFQTLRSKMDDDDSGFGGMDPNSNFGGMGGAPDDDVPF
jgi:replicative DNA helicase